MHFTLTVGLAPRVEFNPKSKRELKRLVNENGLSFYTRGSAINAAKNISESPLVNYVTVTRTIKKGIATYRDGVPYDD
jgi:hypothetical protein